MNLRMRQLKTSGSKKEKQAIDRIILSPKMLVSSVNLDFKLENATSQSHSQSVVNFYCVKISRALFGSATDRTQSAEVNNYKTLT